MFRAKLLGLYLPPYQI